MRERLFTLQKNYQILYNNLFKIFYKKIKNPEKII
tara:strand:+ start:1095 stop:1199 length:105 start_codon:yes stop_codon:yes gene_type:complete